LSETDQNAIPQKMQVSHPILLLVSTYVRRIVSLFPKEYVPYVVCYNSRAGRCRDYTSFTTALRVEENKLRVEEGVNKDRRPSRENK
jgi:hypothetical protein